MKIKILGTGAGTMSTRYKTSIFVPIDDENNLLLDTGGGTEIITQLSKAKIDPTCINHIFVTHLHFDHCLGLPCL
ncbi:MBL fold metallo-hydrolase, partial [Patescibacteria group bacterium]